MQTTNKFFVILINLVCIVSTSYAQHNKTHSNLDSFFSAQIDSFNLVAISAAIVRENENIWSDAYGVKNVENNRVVTSNTLFHQGSLSKTITLAAFLHLLEQEELHLDEDINKFLSFEVRNPNHRNTPITFRMLITHTSSINDVNVSEKDNKMYMLYNNYDTPDKLETTLKNILTEDGTYYNKDFFLSGKPGTEYAYSNVAYSLLGYLIEQISGVSFIDYARRFIFNPLQMDKSTFLLSETDTTDFAYQYYSMPDRPSELIKIEPYTWPGYMDGSLRTTALEYSNFLIMLLNEGKFNGKQVLSGEIIKAIIQIQDLPGKQSTKMFKPSGRALLWNMVEVKVDDKNITVYHFNGYGGGFFTEAYFDPSRKIAGLVFTTGGFSTFEELKLFTEKTVKKMIESTANL